MTAWDSKKMQLGGEGVAPSPRQRPVARKATSPFTPVNRNPLTGEIIHVPGFDDVEEEDSPRPPASITPTKPKPSHINSNGISSSMYSNGQESTENNKNNGHIHRQQDREDFREFSHMHNSDKVSVRSVQPAAQEENHSRQQSQEHKVAATPTKLAATSSSTTSSDAEALQLYDKFVRKGESSAAAHHLMRLDTQQTQVVTSLLNERIVELCNNEGDLPMETYHNDKTCAKVAFIARLVTTRLPHVCDDIVGCLFVKGGRVFVSRHVSTENHHAVPSTSSNGTPPGDQKTAMALFFYKNLGGRRAPLLQPFVSCASLCHIVGWKKGATIGLSDLYVGNEITVEPVEVALVDKPVANYRKQHQHHEQPGEKVQISALAADIIAADRYLTLKIMWLDDAVFQQCKSVVGDKMLANLWVGAGDGGVERIKKIYQVREKISDQLRDMPWTSVCYEVFGHLVNLCLIALQNIELDTRDAPDPGSENGNQTHHQKEISTLADMSTMTKQQLNNDLCSHAGGLNLIDADVDTIFEHLLPLNKKSNAAGESERTVNTLHVADFIAFSWTSEHEVWLLRKAYRKLDPNCTGVVSYKTLAGFTEAGNATLTTHKGVREISSFTGLGSLVKEMFDDFVAGLKKRSPHGITYYDLACFANTLAVNDAWKQPEHDMDRANLIAWCIKRLFSVDD